MNLFIYLPWFLHILYLLFYLREIILNIVLQGIARSFARILLVHCGWDEETLFTLFFERGIEHVFKSAGVVPPKDDEDEQRTGPTAGPRAKSQKKEVCCERCHHLADTDPGTKLSLFGLQLHGWCARDGHHQTELWSSILQRMLPSTRFIFAHSYNTTVLMRIPLHRPM